MSAESSEMIFDADELTSVDVGRRFQGLVRLYGAAGAERIRTAHIVVVGLGGVGSWAAEAAARSGVARLTLIDFDHISESNINRQVHAVSSTLGQVKIQAMRDRIFQINPHCQVDCIEEFVDSVNWLTLLGLGTDVDHKQLAVIDACDQVRAKETMSAWAIKRKINFVSVGAAGGKRLAHRIDVEDLSLVTHDPLLAQMRYRLRKEHGAARQGKIGVTCVFSKEPVLRPKTDCALVLHTKELSDEQKIQSDVSAQLDGSLNCHGYGSMVSVTSTFGMCAAGLVLNKIAGELKN